MDQLLILPEASSAAVTSSIVVGVELTENSGVVALEKTKLTTAAISSTSQHGVGAKAKTAVVMNPNLHHHHSSKTSAGTSAAAAASDVDFDSDTSSTNPLPPAMKKLKLKDDDTSSFAFRNPTKQCLQRIHNDLTKLYKDPIEGIFVVPDDRRANLCHAIVLGPQDTPYEFGFFYFILEFPNQYPHEPPRVTLQTTGGGTVRFNPNLYRCGKVCLSILGTWNGPSWTPALTIGSVLLSIQSLMNATPYHNEPGFETLHKGGRQPQQYNCIIRHETIRVAVIGMVELATKTIQKQQQLERQAQHQQQAQIQHHQQQSSLRGVAPTTTSTLNFVGRLPTRLLPEKFAQLVLETFSATGECCQYICDDYKTRLDGKPFQDPYRRNKGTFRFGKLQSRIKDLLLLQQQQQQQVVMEEG